MVEEADPGGHAEVIHLSDGRLELRTVSSRSAFLVLSDVYYPGWSVTVNGQPADLVRTNYVLRGGEAARGRQPGVALRFARSGSMSGATMSGVAWLAVMGVLAWTWIAAGGMA